MPFNRPAAVSATRIGLGLAALGRPGYINLGRESDLPAERTAEAMEARVRAVLDAAYERGVRYFDVARSYGRAEEFLAGWLRSRPEADDAVIGSKWGYTYTAEWRADATVHEVKDHSLATFERQLAETRGFLGGRLDLYQVHSVTPDSPVLTDRALQDALAALAAEGVTIGLSTSGPGQPAAIRAALRVTVDGGPLFSSVQATYNLLEPSAGPALAEAHEAGRTVIVKEALANGRLVHEAAGSPLGRLARETGTAPDALAIAAVLREPWADIVLSGAATTGQLDGNVSAPAAHLTDGHVEQLSALAVPATDYWRHRSALPWT
ncbi:aldo/keto reductase [Streptomyces abyssalis]|uniref:Aldo/keto reductase n=1 Tax=Streptomyces abyssalis TaxID=933944 RepID=A0A1E7JVK6_9ACTN|nr:aldo/keto reductase [Streptomyces abyssalis]OEU94516.1 aldo/keto reductase [Streptomyces abyssalis]OEU95899.1 aldo/keto reductase [Streptomyces abyssalis]OEV27642.1 aldo/keto reductase [Streptomyces nanshensis]